MWDHYLHEEHLENGDVASDHYHRFAEDIRMMKEGGQNAYRFSISWPRIITDESGHVNQKGLDFYHEVIRACRENGIEPFVTLYHWDLPQYLQKDGGWLNRATCDAYVRFAETVFREFNGEVSCWTTFNEPRWTIVNGYLIGNYPPGMHDGQMTAIGGYHIMLASALAVERFRSVKISGNIGIVHSYTPVEGVDSRPETLTAMRYADNFMNNWILDVAAKGEIPEDFLEALKDKGIDLSFMKPEDLDAIRRNHVDFLGLNYYARALIKPYTSGETELTVNNKGKAAKGTTTTIIKGWFEQARDPSSRYTEWDTEIYPRGLYEGLLKAWSRYHLPMYVTENGIGYYEDVSQGEVQDDWRVSFMNDHINAIMNAAEEGADVRGYFAWSSFDLYSWKNGCEKRYGLVAVDFAHGLKRTPKKSWHWYKTVAESNGDTIAREKY